MGKVIGKKQDFAIQYDVSMVEYDNPKYNYQMWIRLRINSYKDKTGERAN